MIHKLLRLSLTSIGAVTSSTRYNTETFIHSHRELNSCHRLCEAGPLRREGHVSRDGKGLCHEMRGGFCECSI